MCIGLCFQTTVKDLALWPPVFLRRHPWPPSPPGGTASASGVLGGSSSLLANGNNDGASVAPSDETDHLLAHTPDLQKTRAAIEHVSQKIARTRELIKAEQTTRDGEATGKGFLSAGSFSVGTLLSRCD